MQALRNPDLYHGHNKHKNFFEGWYFKLVDASKQHVFAFIPGIFFGSQEDQSHSFVQLVHGTDTYAHYQKYPAAAFAAAKDKFAVRVGENHFSLSGLSMNVNHPDFSVSGTLQFSKVSKWPDSLLAPGSMGFYNYIPNMQCYSQVCAMDLELSGTLCINGKELDFNGGRAYIEKNWGKAFPYSWIWLQSNHFQTPRTSLSCSLAHIPFLTGSFRGFLIGLQVEDRFYSFTTMNKSKITIQNVTSGDVVLHIQNSRYELTIESHTDPDKFILLYGPRDGEMKPLVYENLLGRIRIELKEKSGPLLLADEGTCSGVEYGGDQMQVLG